MRAFTDQDKLIREKTFLLAVPLFAVAGLLWAGIYYYYGAKMSALIPGGYGLMSLLSLLIYRWHKDFNIFRAIQLMLILLLPCLLHLSLGNFISSSAVIIWAIVCPLGALAFQNSKAAGYWLLLFIICVLLVFFMEDKVAINETQLPDKLISIFFALNISAVTLVMFYLLRYFVNQNQRVKEQLKHEQALLEIEQEKSEKLLLNILPVSIAQRLKAGEKIIADEHDKAVILFADIVEFTNISEHVTPKVLVENLNKVFTHFDGLVDKYGLEKIKTIGDAYMVAAGLNGFTYDQVKNMADLALSMACDIKNFTLDGHTKCDLRIGLHIGSVTAGVIGSKKFSYDVWGDAVNTASRMESFSEAGKIQVSQEFYNYIKDDYECLHRGKVEIKGKGLMDLYFLRRKKEQPSEKIATE
ncbi:MAG TPA: adenylate/guanylate cyclase domain-containing protein [Chitinophagaceae bacterium]|nr:adenylate/guanylate cyclase domain-containing protein [Chitinophagaceae bacterium]